MKSSYLKSLSDQMRQYRHVLIYGAGGVAENLLILLESYIDKNRIVVAVSNIKEERQLAGYPDRKSVV